MNRVVTTAAAAAAYALLSAVDVRHAHAQLVFDSFSYPAAAALSGQVNPINGQAWSQMSSSPGSDQVLVGSTSLSYSGLAASSGNSVSYSGVGHSERLGFDRVARSGEMFYSLVLRVSDLGTTPTTPNFVAGFSNASGPSGITPTTVGTRLYLRQVPNSSPATFHIGVSKNSSFDITWADTTEYALNTPLLVVGSYEIVGTENGTNDISKIYINPIALGAASAPTSSTPASPIITAPVVGTDLTASNVPSVAAFVLRQGTGVPSVQVDELRVDSAWARVTPPTGVSWNITNGGAWSQGANWSTAASPNSPDAFVNFNGNITGPRTIDVDVPVALRTITFNSTQPYTLAAGGAGAGALNFSASAGVNVRSGSHTIAAPVALGGEMLFSVATAAALNLTGTVTGGAHTIIKAGDGTMTMKNLRAGSVDVVAGSIAITPDGTAAGTSHVTTLALGPDATLDLANNAIVVRAGDAGAATEGTYNGVQGDVQRAYNFGSWNAPGLTTSTPLALQGITTIGVGTGEQIRGLGPTDTDIWGGQTINGASVIAMYTYAGDANLDGQVDAGDYGILDAFVQVAGATGYANGDFNYDGFIDAADYGTIDNTIQFQGPPLGGGGIAGAPTLMSAATAVPEPSAAAVTLMTIAGVLARRRRSAPPLR